MAALLAWIASPIGKIVGLLVLAGTLLAGGWGLIKIHDASVRAQALAEFNKSQLEEVVKDQRAVIEQLQELQKIQAEEAERARVAREAAETQARELAEWIDSEEKAGNNQAASPFLKEALKRLFVPGYKGSTK